MTIHLIGSEGFIGKAIQKNSKMYLCIVGVINIKKKVIDLIYLIKNLGKIY